MVVGQVSDKYLPLVVFVAAVCLGILVLNLLQGGQIEQPADQGSGGAPPLHIYGYASIGATISEVEIKEMNIAVVVNIGEVLSYTTAESSDILLHQGDNITIEFSGIGDKTTWRAMDLKSGDRIWANLRALVSFVDDPYWECFDDNWGFSYEIF